MNTILVLSLLVLGLIAWATSKHWYLTVTAKPVKGWVTILVVVLIWGTAFWVVNRQDNPTPTIKVAEAETAQVVTVTPVEPQEMTQVVPVVPNVSPKKSASIDFKKYTTWCLSVVVGGLIIWLTRKWTGPRFSTIVGRVAVTWRDWLVSAIIVAIIAILMWTSYHYGNKAVGVGKEVPTQVVTPSTATATTNDVTTSTNSAWLTTSKDWVTEHWLAIVIIAVVVFLIFSAVRTGKVKPSGANVWEFLMLLIVCIVVMQFIEWGRSGAGNTIVITPPSQSVPADTVITVTDKWSSGYPVKRGLCYLNWATASSGFIVTA